MIAIWNQLLYELGWIHLVAITDLQYHSSLRLGLGGCKSIKQFFTCVNSNRIFLFEKTVLNIETKKEDKKGQKSIHFNHLYFIIIL